MKYAFIILLTTLALTACGTRDQSEYTLIKDVSIIPMTDPEKVFKASILLKDSVILKIGTLSAADIPANTKIIDASGKYAIPGMWDTHFHLFKATRQSIPALFKYGITSVRDMGGDTDTLKNIIRDIRTGKIKGPRILFCGPTFESPWFMDWFSKNRSPESENVLRTRINLKSKEDAQRVVDSVVALGVDFIKLRYFKDPETYWALARAVRKRGLRFEGHPPAELDQSMVADSGQTTFEHGWYPLLSGLDSLKAKELVQKFIRNNCVLVPTAITWSKGGFTRYSKLDSLINGPSGVRDPRIDSLPPTLLAEWKEQLAERKLNKNTGAWNRQALYDMLAETGSMFRQGMNIMPGSDVPGPYVFPGESIHEELNLFVTGIGMTPYEALQSATAVPAKYFKLNTIGTIEEGKLADLVILSGNPVTDIKNLSTINWVFKNGRVVYHADK